MRDMSFLHRSGLMVGSQPPAASESGARCGVSVMPQLFVGRYLGHSAQAARIDFRPQPKHHAPMSFLSLAFIERLAEERIKQAQEEGAFDALPGRGRPLDLEDDAHVPEDLRLAWRVLKNAGCLPPELEARLCECVKGLLPTLSPDHADILARVDLGGATPAEAALALGITANAASVRLHRARKALHERLVATCGTCTEHGCLDCRCGEPSSGGGCKTSHSHPSSS